jgi:hypothetical protein
MEDNMTDETNPNQNNESINIEDLQSQLANLKSNKDSILQERKKLSERNSQLEGLINSIGGEEGLQQLIEMKNKAQDDHQKTLLEQGKFNEAMSNTTNQLKAQYDAKLKALSEDLEKTKDESEAYKSRYREKLILDKVLSTSKRLDLADTAYKDIALHVMNDFSFDENNNPVIVEDGLKKLNGKGDVYGIDDYINDMRKDFPHWNKPVDTGFSKGALRGVSSVKDYSVMSKDQIMKDRFNKKFSR